MSELISTRYIVRDCREKTASERYNVVVKMILDNLTSWDITNLTNVDGKTIAKYRKRLHTVQ
jgi:hypothetical protein